MTNPYNFPWNATALVWFALNDGPWNAVTIPTSDDAVSGYSLDFAGSYAIQVGWFVSGLNIFPGSVVTGISTVGMVTTITMADPNDPLQHPVEDVIPHGTKITFFPMTDLPNLVGGIDLDVYPSGITNPEVLVYMIVQGSDVSLQWNTGTVDAPLVFGPPSSFSAWPDGGGGGDRLDPTKNGGVAILSNNNTTMNTNSFYGASQSVHGWTGGNWYSEITLEHATLFTVYAGGGPGLAFPGIDYSFWAVGPATYGSLDSFGGANVTTNGDTLGLIATIGKFGGIVGPLGTFTGTLRIAVYLPPVIIPITGVEAIGEVGTLALRNPLSMTALNVTEFPVSQDRFVNLKYSDDAGATWRNTVQRTMGQIGELDTTIQYRQLGQARNRVYEISWSSPYATALTGFMVETIESGT